MGKKETKWAAVNTTLRMRRMATVVTMALALNGVFLFSSAFCAEESGVMAAATGTSAIAVRSPRAAEQIAGNNIIGTNIYPDSGFALLEGCDMETEDDRLDGGVIDPVSGYGYWGTESGRVVKVDLRGGVAPPVRVGAAILESGEVGIRCGVIDTANGYAYFGTFTSPGRVIKVALGEGNAPPYRVGALTLQTGENNLKSAIIDPEKGYAYFGTFTSTGQVVKVALGAGAAPPTRVGALTLASGDNYMLCGVIDPANGYSYWGTYTAPGRVIKVALGAGANPPTRVGATDMEYAESKLDCAAIDLANGHAYFGAESYPGRVVKVALGTGAAPPTRLGGLLLASGENFLHNAMIDTENSHGYFLTEYAQVIKVALGAGTLPPTRVDSIVHAPHYNYSKSGLIDVTRGYLWLGSNNNIGTKIYRVRIGAPQMHSIKASRITLPEPAAPQTVCIYSHTARGNVRLALYNTSASPTLLWQSGIIPNTAAGDWLTVPIASGQPTGLWLLPGDYWLAWQVDTPANVPSYTPGEAGEGFTVPFSWGPFPERLESGSNTQITLTAERWSAYFEYNTRTSAMGWYFYE